MLFTFAITVIFKLPKQFHLTFLITLHNSKRLVNNNCVCLRKNRFCQKYKNRNRCKFNHTIHKLLVFVFGYS